MATAVQLQLASEPVSLELKSFETLLVLLQQVGQKLLSPLEQFLAMLTPLGTWPLDRKSVV